MVSALHIHFYEFRTTGSLRNNKLAYEPFKLKVLDDLLYAIQFQNLLTERNSAKVYPEIRLCESLQKCYREFKLVLH